MWRWACWMDGRDASQDVAGLYGALGVLLASVALGPAVSGGEVAVTPDQQEKTVFVLRLAVQAIYNVPGTTSEERFEEVLGSFIKVWESFVADAREHHRQQRELHNEQGPGDN